MRLRRYQEDACQAVKEAAETGTNRSLITMPTGTGKTVAFAKVIDDHLAAGGTRAVVLAHREELLDQAKEKLERVCPRLQVSVEAAERRSGAMDDVVVASVQTVGRPKSERLQQLRGADMLIVDEAHHAAAASYQVVMEALGCYDGACRTVGVTATPKRLDNKPLFGHREAVFEREVFRYELRDAIEDGYLCDIRGFKVESAVDLSKVKTRGGDYAQGQLQRVVDTELRNSIAIAAWHDIARDRKTLVFCSGVEHAYHVAEQFAHAGVTAAALDGSTDKEERRAILERFRAGDLQVLCNVEVLTEGFDVPDVDCVVMLRPTQSWGLYCQMVGRGTRTLPGVIDSLEDSSREDRRAAIGNSRKRDCLVLDVVDLSSKHELGSVPALLGMPSRLDLQGHTLTEAAAVMDDLGARAGAMQVNTPTTFDDVARLITAVDLLMAHTVVPDEVQRHSPYSWIATGDGSYALDCGPSADGTVRRTGYLQPDALGHYTLRVSDAHGHTVRAGSTLASALRNADAMLARHWPTMGAFATREARWKQRPASDKQMAMIRHLRLNIPAAANLTAGQASLLISRAMASRSGRA